MRIVGGRWGGRTIEAPEGRGVTRPTTERTRESMASMVLSACGLDAGSLRVLDAFAGSGAIGFELLSRGASWCLFCDKDRRAAARVRRNAATLGAGPDECRVVSADVRQLARRGALANGPYTLVVLDPPYAMGAEEVCELVKALADGGSLADGALILYEHARESAGLELEGLRPLKSKSHAISTVDLMRYGGQDE